jgi:Flp pilus assembly protein TadD
MPSKGPVIVLVCTVAFGLAGCMRAMDQTGGEGAPLTTSSAELSFPDPALPFDPAPAASLKAKRDGDEDLNFGKRYYRERNFGLAEKHYRLAVERSPQEVEAWLGLAASYDQLGRFDLADRAYDQALIVGGPNAEILNNQGYSYMLRGDFKTARAKLEKARSIDPANQHIEANMALLEESQ